MRKAALPFLAICVLLAVAGCGQSNTAEKAGKPTGSANRQEALLRLAQATEAAGDPAGAEKLYLRVIDSYPSSAIPYTSLAEFYRRHDHTDKALSLYGEALKRDPGNAALLRENANACINAGKTQQARELLDRAIALHPDDAFAYNSRGVALDIQGRYGEAQQSYRKALALDPADAMTFDANLSMSYIVSGAYDQAITLLRPLLADAKANATIRQNLAMAYGMKGERQQAMELGLQDLTPQQARENLKFYSMISHSPQANGQPAMDSESARAKLREVFPEEEESDSASPGVSQAARTIPPPADMEPLKFPPPSLRPHSDY